MADLLAFDLARIARHEAGDAQLLAQLRIVFHERARDAVTDRAGLAGDAAAGHRHRDVELVRELHELERLTDDHATGLATEEFIERTLVDGDLAGTGLEEDARRGGLAAAGAVVGFGLSGH